MFLFAGSMTLIVIVLIAICLIGGVYATWRAWRMRRTVVKRTCQRCGTANPQRAKFCAQCGQDVTD